MTHPTRREALAVAAALLAARPAPAAGVSPDALLRLSVVGDEAFAPGEAGYFVPGDYDAEKRVGPLTARDLPVDAHELVALCAPRPVFISAGSQRVEGGWVDARGTFLAGVGAGPVYELLGKRGLGTAVFPEETAALTDGEVAFRQHEGGHTTGPNWPTFLTWAGRYVKAPGK